MLAGDTPDVRPGSGLADLLRAGNRHFRSEAAGVPVRPGRPADGGRAVNRRVPAQERHVPRSYAGAPTILERSLRTASGTARLPTRGGDLERPDRDRADSGKGGPSQFLSGGRLWRRRPTA